MFFQIPYMKNGIDDLQKSLHEVSAKIYGQGQGQGAYQGAPPGGMGGTGQHTRPKTQDEIEEEQFRKATGQDEGVVDAEYE